ncbi:NADH-quinone oxidoreductase subunit NuoN [Rehaibacterium terrae]|jgi:NADH-quinone oxidoreductase subunit N|uniref:NADH-quinone oxidoreductase subunit N n=1 Tax=Rehaibacterium terrae TaxID=1341696 RepID=A0A7W7XZB2_9GAMM|nr:NADH-quinone oxidoreductase subunit NuoN [Rehaibacterium terrae]MBB5015200.1 NADH-quinone oxidoreductase subunit N [Rehaibacterium terrae]
MVTSADFLLLAPELLLLGATCAILLLDLFLSDQRRGLVHFLAIFTLIATGILTFRQGGAGALPDATAFGGMFIRDTASDVLKLVIYVVTGAAFVYAKPWLVDRGLFKGEFYVLTLFAVLGMMILVSAGNLITVYLGLELLALSSYALVAMDRDNRLASEAAMKYFVLGALASGMLLYGMSMIYGASGGSLDLGAIYSAAAADGDKTLLMFGVVFVLAGIAFKFGAAPFHMWLPDVYQGAPTPVTLFIGSAPKLAAFGMAYRLLEGAAGPLGEQWQIMVAWLAVLSLATGNLIALMQTNLKRMLAYSTISHVGFLFLGLAAADAQGYAAAMFYAISYALMSAAAFASIILLSRKGFEAENIADFRGLNARNPWHALLVLCIMASLAGVPPFLGFWAKLAVLRAAVEAGMIWLAIVGVVFAVIGAFYYLRVIKAMYFDEPEGETGPAPAADPHLRWLLSVNALLLLGLGLAWSPVMVWCQRAFGI